MKLDELKKYAPMPEHAENTYINAVHSLREEPVMKKKISTALVFLLILLLVAITAFAATNWLGFIKEKYSIVEPTAHVGMLAMIDQLHGNNLSSETVVDDVSVQLHYAVASGEECVTLFSMRNTKPDMDSVEKRLFIAEIAIRTEDCYVLGNCNITPWYDEDNQILYCLGSTYLVGGDLPSSGVAEMTLSIITQEPIPGEFAVFENAEPFWEARAEIEIGGQIESTIVPLYHTISFNESLISFTEMKLSTTGIKLLFEGKFESDPSQSLFRQYGFEWHNENGLINMTLIGVTSTQEEGVTIGEFYFMGVQMSPSNYLDLTVWRRDDPDTVQTISILPTP